MSLPTKTPGAGEQPRATFKQSKWRQFNRLVLHAATDPWLAALIALALWLKVSSAQAYATIPPALNRAGAEHTIEPAVASPTVSGLLSRPESLAGTGISGPDHQGFGRDEPIRKDGCTAGSVCSTSRPPYALEQAAGGFQSQPGA